MYLDFNTIPTYYDALYVNDRESARVKELLTGQGLLLQGDLLVLACSTGGNIPYFKDDYNLSGLDLSGDILDLSREKFPDIRLFMKGWGFVVALADHQGFLVEIVGDEDVVTKVREGRFCR